MFKPQVFEKITALPEDDQKKIVKWMGSHNAMEIEDIRQKFSPQELEDVVETIAEINSLFRCNNRRRFSEIVEEMNIPIQIKNLYLPDTEPIYISYKFKWRIDITVTKANAILFNVLKENGEEISFRLDMSTFHSLRFNVAMMLKELGNAKKSYLRIKKF